MVARCVLACLVLLLSGAVVAVGRAGATGEGQLALSGFQEESDPLSAIDQSASGLTTVGVDGVELIGHGLGVGTPDPAALAQLARAHADHLRAELLVNNWDEAISNFSEPLAHGMLANRTAIGKITGTLARDLVTGGWDGISVDLEALNRRDERGLVRFVRALRAALPAVKTISVCVTNLDVAARYPATGYNLAALGVAADRVILMGYDEHGPWENTPGPVGALWWQTAGLVIALASVPAAKLDLGQAGYGYAWRPHSNRQISDAQARALVARNHATARWVAAVGEWTASLPDGSTLWWADARSLKLRESLAASLHLHGLAVWSLGLADPIS
jgi:spore germination protein YaaH